MVVVIVASFGVSVLATAPSFLNGMWWVGIPVILIYGFVIWIFRTTYYVIEGSELLVRSGPFRWRVTISEIDDILPTRNPLSSPALSLDRLKISYSNGRSIMISPADREGFLKAIEGLRRRGSG